MRCGTGARSLTPVPFARNFCKQSQPYDLPEKSYGSLSSSMNDGIGAGRGRQVANQTRGNPRHVGEEKVRYSYVGNGVPGITGPALERFPSQPSLLGIQVAAHTRRQLGQLPEPQQHHRIVGTPPSSDGAPRKLSGRQSAAVADGRMEECGRNLPGIRFGQPQVEETVRTADIADPDGGDPRQNASTPDERLPCGMTAGPPPGAGKAATGDSRPGAIRPPQCTPPDAAAAATDRTDQGRRAAALKCSPRSLPHKEASNPRKAPGKASRERRLCARRRSAPRDNPEAEPRRLRGRSPRVRRRQAGPPASEGPPRRPGTAPTKRPIRRKRRRAKHTSAWRGRVLPP